jgi:hypothetical protein
VSLNTAWIELNDSLKTLRLAWEAARERWKDTVARDFEANRWQPLEAQVVSTLRALDVLAPVLAAARRDCSPDSPSLL